MPKSAFKKESNSASTPLAMLLTQLKLTLHDLVQSTPYFITPFYININIS